MSATTEARGPLSAEATDALERFKGNLRGTYKFCSKGLLTLDGELQRIKKAATEAASRQLEILGLDQDFAAELLAAADAEVWKEFPELNRKEAAGTCISR